MCDVYRQPVYNQGRSCKRNIFCGLFQGVQRKIVNAKRKRKSLQRRIKSVLKKMQKSSDDFLQSDFFYTDIVPVDTKVKKVQDNHDAYPVQGIFAIFLLELCILRMQRDMSRKGYGYSMPFQTGNAFCLHVYRNWLP